MARPNHKQVRLSHGSALVFTFIISCEEMLDDIARQPHRSQCRCIDTAPARSDFSQNLFATANNGFVKGARALNLFQQDGRNHLIIQKSRLAIGDFVLERDPQMLRHGLRRGQQAR